jgi:hypothetical protein
MAQMVPPDEPRSVTRSERHLFEVLRERLPDSYLVYHSLDYVISDGDWLEGAGPATQGGAS